MEIDPKDEDGWTPLHFAAWMGRESAVIMLLEAGELLFKNFIEDHCKVLVKYHPSVFSKLEICARG